MFKRILNYRKIRLSSWLLLAIFFLSSYFLQNIVGSAYYSLILQPFTTVGSPSVILQDGIAGTSTIYTNSTSAKVSVEAPLFDYVDSNDPNVDSSADKGMHSNFAAQQAIPDSIYDTLTEENTQGIEDYVDNNVSDMDGSGDKGTLSDFDSMKTKDGMANLTEVADGTPTDLQVPTTCMDQMWNQGQDYEWYSAWTPPGSGTVTVTKLWFWDGDGTVGTSETIYMAMYEDGGGYSKLSGSDTTLTGTGSQGWLFADVSTSFEITLGTTYWIGATCASGGTYNICRDDGANSANYPPNGVGTYYQTNNYVLDSYVPTGASQSINKYIIPGITYTTGTGDYELDQEVQFTNVIDLLPTEKLCIYAGPLGDEDLRVDYWNGTGWDNLATDLIAYSCNEYTVSLTSVNFTIRFKGGTESSDTTQDQWHIAACLLRVEGAASEEDAVDQQSNVDSSSDVGTHSDFNAMKTKDGYDNLTESLDEQQFTFFEDWESGSIASENWTTYSSAAQGRIVVAPDTPYAGSYALWMDVNTNLVYSLNELITNYDFSGATQIVLDFYHNEQGDENEAGSDHTDHQNADGVYYTLDGSYWYHLANLVDPSGWTNININVTADPDFQGPVNSSFAIKFTQYDNYPRPNDGRGFENINITYTAAGTDYAMDLEVQWIGLPYSLPNENISIYGGTMGTEDIKVDVWNGTGWETVFTNLSSGWNNASITNWLTTSNFTIRFKDGNETGDPSQDMWQIDVALVHVWYDGGEDFELDLEVQWTGADYTRINEELCIKTGTFSGSENIQVKVWNSTGSSWHWVMNLTANQWNNVSITSHLISDTLTVQFLGGSETDDTTQDNWNIDATLLHVWSGWLSDWDTRVRITIDQNDIDTALSNFPILVHLSNSSSGRNSDDVSFIFDELQNDTNRKKIAVTESDGVTQCYVEIERWDDANEKAWLWVRTPSINNTTDTVFYLYYDKDHADNTAYVGDTGSTVAQNVWDSSFKGVWHLSETSGGVGAIKDSTSNNNVGTDNSSPTFNATGLIDGAISFDGFDDYINMSNSASLQFTSSLTIEAWINLDSFGSGSDVDIILRKGEGNPNDYQLAIHDQKLALVIEENDDAGLESSVNLTATTWYYLTGTWNGSIRRVYLNGSEDGSGSKIGSIVPDTRDIYIGGRLGTDLSTGVIDEVRASNTTRSAAWVKASYESGRDDLLDFGSEETSTQNFDYVLRVNNTITDSWEIRLKKYSDFNINRLQNCNIYLHNSTDGNSDQIKIENGAYTQDTGSWYNLTSSSTIYIAITVEANNTETSKIYTYLEILISGTTTYAQCIITFEIT